MFSRGYFYLVTVLVLMMPLGLGCSERTGTADDKVIQQAFEKKQSNIWVESSGLVVNLLTDDINPPRHQRFIIRLDHGQTLMVSHNIDLAPRIWKLQKGDRILFRGEYLWNDQGGVIHWTHKNPSGQQPGGWIILKGRRYQ